MENRKSLCRNIGLFLREARKNKSLSAYQLGCLIKLSQQQVSRYELGVTKINIEMLDLFLTALDKTWSDFFFSVIIHHSDDIKQLKEYGY